MTKPLRIVFMGTPKFATETLKALINSYHQVVAVVTAPDRKAGRGKKLKQSEVKHTAIQHQLPVLQPLSLKSMDFLNHLKSYQPDLIVVVAFRMLPKQVWKLPPKGTFNLHASILPQYRGAAPIHWSIINGESETGVTTFFIDEKIDTGAILLQQKTSIGLDETTGQLHDRLQIIGSNLVVQTVNEIAQGTLVAMPQAETKTLQFAPKLTKENTRINWHDSGVRIRNKIRGLNPYPVAWTELSEGGNRIIVKLLSVDFLFQVHQEEIGSIKCNTKQLFVHVKDGIIQVNRLQLANKKAMDTLNLLNGYQIHPSSQFI